MLELLDERSAFQIVTDNLEVMLSLFFKKERKQWNVFNQSEKTKRGSQDMNERDHSSNALVLINHERARGIFLGFVEFEP